jgi:hypothetical protein
VGFVGSLGEAFKEAGHMSIVPEVMKARSSPQR